MKSARQMMLELVAIGSVSESHGEIEVAHKILALVREDGYFTEHPDHCGLWDGGDRLGRPVIWALKKGRGSKTVLFSGHYDTVGTASYGAFEPLALTPDALMAAMRENPPDDEAIIQDLEDGRWLFGRGCADMKAGIALNIQMLHSYEVGTEASAETGAEASAEARTEARAEASAEAETGTGDVNVLMTAVSDEENLSAGARQAAGLYTWLTEKFGLQYVVAAESEPYLRNAEPGDPVRLINGSAGKILPVVVAHGIPIHSSNMMGGLNSAQLIAGIAQKTEYDTAFVSKGGSLYTMPPATLLLRDLKSGYDVSLPEYSAAAFNMTFFMETDPVTLLNHLLGDCRTAAAELLERYHACFDEMVKAGQIEPSQRKDFDVRILTLQELENELSGKPGFEEFRASARSNCAEALEKGETMQMAAVFYLRDMMAFSGIAEPFAVVGIAPPYYPAVNNDFLKKDIRRLVQNTIAALEQEGIAAEKEDYTPAMMDLSYLSCANPKSAGQVMDNMPIPRSLYDMDLEAMAAIEIPTLVIGPLCRDIHQVGERVFLPDIDETIPAVFRQLVKSVELMSD